MTEREGDGLYPAVHPELGEHPLDVRAHRLCVEP
jgi:hypothetical protein